jgi:signal transduction histidine kinase
MSPKDLWVAVSNAGVRRIADKHLRRKVTLCNQISFSVGVAMIFSGVNHYFWGFRALTSVVLVCATLYFFIILLNHKGHFQASRIALSGLPPPLIVMLSGLLGYPTISFKLALISVILAPILLFGITERRLMLVGIGWVVCSYLAMDVIAPMIPKITSAVIEPGMDAVSININGMISFFMFTVSFVYFQRLNLRAENDLSAMLDQVQAQKAIIERKSQKEMHNAELALARQIEMNALKSTFLAMTSHEFRTPLTGILSSTEILRHYGGKLTDAERDSLFDSVDTAVQRMTDMLDKVLTIGRADADLLEFRPAKVNLPSLCQRLVDEASLYKGAGAASVTLQIDFAEELALVDTKLLSHCLGNLLGNAIKYSPAGGAATLVVHRNDGAILFEVSDQGIGIPAEDLPKLFSTFHRAGNVGNIPGTGLGLAIVKRAVERHNGTIQVDSVLGRGTRFLVTIPDAWSGHSGAL